ncbi:unnamed protein product, partial [Closterium sp. Naga37s-1]
VFSVESQQQLRSARVGSLPLASMALLPPLPSHCYPSVLLGSSDDHVWLYSPDFGRCLSKMHAHDDTVSCIQVSQWGAETCLFTASWDGSVKQWSMAHSPFLSASPFASFSSSSPHSHAGSDTSVHPPPLAELNQHDAPITLLQVAIPAMSAWPLAASGSANGAVLLWDMRAPPSASVPWSCRLSPLTTTAPTSPLAVTGLVFSYGGLHITTADSTGGLRVLEMRMGGDELASQHCPGGGLTCCQPLGDQSVLAGSPLASSSLLTPVFGPLASWSIRRSFEHSPNFPPSPAFLLSVIRATSSELEQLGSHSNGAKRQGARGFNGLSGSVAAKQHGHRMAGKDVAVPTRGCQLEQLVLTWNIEDIFNDELLREKVRPIPTTFPDVPSYLSAFRWPLLEECRVGLKRGLEQLPAAASTRIVVKVVQRDGDGRAARADGCGEVERDDWQRQFVSYSGDDDYCQGEVLGRSVHGSALDEIAPPWRMVPHGQPIGRCRGQLGGAAGEAHSTDACSETERFCYVRFEVQQQQPAGAAGAAAKLQWGGAARLRLKPTDVVLLSTVASSAPTDLLRPGVLYRLAVLLAERNSSGEDGDGDRCFWARICTSEDSPEYQGLVGAVDGGECAGGASWYVTLVGSLATPQRVWDALHDPLPSATPDCAPPPPPCFLPSVLSPAASSQSASTAAPPLLQLVQGPPGTGKTHTLSVLLSVALALGYYQSQQQQQRLPDGWPFQFEKAFLAGGRLHVGDIVLVANEERLVVDPELDSILLGEGRRREPRAFLKRKGGVCCGRVTRLLGALSLQSGWRSSVLTLMSFLETSEEEMSRVHQAHLKVLETRIKEELGWSDSKTVSKNGTEGLPNLLEFFQERVAQLVDPAMEGAVSLAYDLPSALLPERERVLLLQAGELMAALQQLLLCPGLSSDAVLSWLDGSHTQEEDGFEFSISSVLHEAAGLLAPFEDAHSTSQSSAISNDSTAASSSTRDVHVCISLPQAERLFHSIRRHLKHIGKQSPAFHIPTLSSNPSAATVAAQCMAGARLVLSTVSSSARALVRCSGHFPLLLLDEAAQLVEAESLVALQARGLRYAVLVGDPKQLPATVMSKVAVQGHYNRSLFERLQSTGWHAELLSVQYRMHPDISRFPSLCFYHGRIEDGPNVCQPSHCPPHLHLLFGPYRFFHVRGREERDSVAVDAGSRSVANSVEAAVVIALLARLSNACRCKEGGAVKVGLISPYARQVELLQRAVEAKPWPSLTVEVNTVDGFQGRESSLNVAITRARHTLWVVGDTHTLRRGDSMWAQLLQDAERRGCLVEARSDEGLARAVERRWVQVGEAQQLLKPHSGLWAGLHWEAAFSQEFQRSMRQTPSLEVINAVRRLMQGHRPQWDTRPRHELSDPRYHDIIHVQPVGRAFLIWTVDISPESYQQMIKVWDVVPERGVLPWLHRLAKGLASFSDQPLDCCAASSPCSARRVHPRQFNRHAPFEWWREGQRGTNVPASHPASAAIPERAPVDENVLLMKFYPLSLGSAQHLMAAVPGEWLFKLNEQQAAIVHSNCTAFVLGRSGTGKTTVITHRLLLLEHTFRRAMGERRLLTSENSQSVRAVRSGASRGREQRGWGTYEELEESEEEEGEGKSGEEGEEERGGLRQVVVTPSAHLCAAIKRYVNKATRTMLQADEHGGPCMPAVECQPDGPAKRAEGETQLAQAGEEEQDELLLLEEAEEKLLGDLPEALDSVAPAAFPLVLTFKKLLSMVNATLSHPFQTGGSSTGSGWGRGGSVGGRWSGDGLPGGVNAVWEEVDYERFEAVYWPRLNAATTRHLDASAVFKEIFSHIKGSLHALRSPHGRVSLQDYVLLARTRTSSLNEEQRTAIYALFLQYERLKRQRGDHDMCDHHSSSVWQQGWVSSAAIGTSRAVGAGGKVVAGPPFQYVYVDEVQDLTQAQIAILQFLCSNVATGFFFAGDTAQTIARGVDFRFQDVRRLFYELFLGKGVASAAGRVERSEEVDGGRGGVGGGVSGREIVESGRIGEEKEGGCEEAVGQGERIQEEVRGEGSAGKEEAGVRKPCAGFSKRAAGAKETTSEAVIDPVAGTRDGTEVVCVGPPAEDRSSCTEMPDLQFLSQNFRSHSGIVRVADSVVRVLLHFFPHSVDRLQPEFSQQQGEPPVFLQSGGSRDRVAQLFGKRGGIGGGGCEFGAEQVILVRDAARRTELVERTGLRGLLLSVHECKGLEFQDALIYNFFSHSLLASGWRLLYEYMRQHHLIPSTAQSSSSSQWQCPAFDPRRHNLLCSELKQLYVVLTRARQRLWIYEEDEAARQPAMDLWEAMGLVVVRPLTNDLIASMLTESSPEKWHKRSLEMFNAGQFEAAEMSFERAGDERRAAVAHAALLQQTAKRQQGTDHRQACQTFQDAAQAFLAVERPRDAAGCLASAGEMERAGYTGGGSGGGEGGWCVLFCPLSLMFNPSILITSCPPPSCLPRIFPVPSLLLPFPFPSLPLPFSFPSRSLLLPFSFPVLSLFILFSFPSLSLFFRCSFSCPSLLLPFSFPSRSLLLPLSYPAASLLLPCSFPSPSLLLPFSFPSPSLLLSFSFPFPFPFPFP